MDAWMSNWISATSLLVSAAAFLFGVFTYARGARRQNRQSTLDYAETIRERTKQLDTKISESLKLDTRTERLSRVEAKRLLNHEAEHRVLMDDIALLLSKLEHLALSARIGIFDIAAINKLMGRKFIRSHNFFVDYIDEVRRLPGESQTTYEHLSWLARELHEMRLREGIPSELAIPSAS